MADVKKTWTISEQEFRHHTKLYDGLCIGCGQWTSGGVEPDAHNYHCEDCGENKVSGAEDAMVIGRLFVRFD